MDTETQKVPTLSIIIPVFNEEKTLRTILEKVKNAPLPNLQKEIIIIDDGSTDSTREILKTLQGAYRIILKERNGGKGACIRTGFDAATGDYIIIQDADLEYDPTDYENLVAPLLRNEADVVYGTRFSGKREYINGSMAHHYANIFLTFLSNVCSGLRLTDVETCYKTFTKDALVSFKDKLISERFGIEIELTAQIAKHKLRVVEVPVAYIGRSYTQGKKIGWKDGVAAIYHILYFNLIR